MYNYCPECGSKLVENAKFCSQCGKRMTEWARVATAPPDRVELLLSDIRIHPGKLQDFFKEYPELLSQITDDMIGFGGLSITVPKSSPLVAGYQQPFDANSIPSPMSWVPLDCAWAAHPYPGHPRISGRRLNERFGSLGVLTGRPLAEISRIVGPPDSVIGITATWVELKWYGGYKITLRFDNYGVCVDVLEETQF